MRFKLNLASQPYENARRFFAQWGTALVALLIVSGLLVYAAARSWRTSHTLARSIAEERSRLDKLNAEEKDDIAILNKAQNADVRERSQVLNGLIARKAFSWTRIFNDLEQMMPTRLHVVSISPRLTPDNQIEIHMLVAGDSHDKAVELVQNMEKSADFRGAQILAENTATKTQAQPKDMVTFEIAARYEPSAAAAISVAEKKTSDAEDASEAQDEQSGEEMVTKGEARSGTAAPKTERRVQKAGSPKLAAPNRKPVSGGPK